MTAKKIALSLREDIELLSVVETVKDYASFGSGLDTFFVMSWLGTHEAVECDGLTESCPALTSASDT